MNNHDPIRNHERLGGMINQAQQYAPPPVDVAAEVLSALEPQPLALEPVWNWCGIASVAFALLALAAGISVWSPLLDNPLIAFHFQSFYLWP